MTNTYDNNVYRMIVYTRERTRNRMCTTYSGHHAVIVIPSCIRISVHSHTFTYTRIYIRTEWFKEVRKRMIDEIRSTSCSSREIIISYESCQAESYCIQGLKDTFGKWRVNFQDVLNPNNPNNLKTYLLHLIGSD